MEKTLNRIEEALDQNWAVEAEDIRLLVDEWKEQRMLLKFVDNAIVDCKMSNGSVILGDYLEKKIHTKLTE